MSTASTEWARATASAHEIRDLLGSLPGPDTTPAERAAWLRRKYTLIGRIAVAQEDAQGAQQHREALAERHGLEVGRNFERQAAGLPRLPYSDFPAARP